MGKAKGKGDEAKGEQWLLTKGDNNAENDVGLYNGLKYLQRSNIVGKVDGYIPYVGYVTIMMVRCRSCHRPLLSLIIVWKRRTTTHRSNSFCWECSASLSSSIGNDAGSWIP